MTFPAALVRTGTLIALLLVALGASHSLTPTPRADTLEGTVRDVYGEPIPSARVELLDGGRRLASAWTGRDGSFQIVTAEARRSGWTVRVERLGYESTQSPVPSAGGPVEIVVRAAPLPLPGFRVEVERDVCSAPEVAVARSLWEAAVRLHAAGLDTLGIATYTEEWTDTMSTDGSRSGGAARSSPGQRASAPLLRVSWSRRVERQGYGFPVRRSDRERSYDSWSYPPLEADFASHFVGESFGSLHEFHLDVADAEGWVLRFCGTEQDRPFLLGALELGPDTLIRRAEWQFFTPEPDEAAGGWARFDPAAPGEGASALLPRESLIWRTLPGGSVVRRAQSYLGWITTPGDSVPFLPARVEAAGAGGGVSVEPSSAGRGP